MFELLLIGTPLVGFCLSRLSYCMRDLIFGSYKDIEQKQKDVKICFFVSFGLAFVVFFIFSILAASIIY